MYEFETDDIQKFDAVLKENGRKSKERGRLSDLIVVDPRMFAA